MCFLVYIFNVNINESRLDTDTGALAGIIASSHLTSADTAIRVHFIPHILYVWIYFSVIEDDRRTVKNAPLKTRGPRSISFKTSP